MNVYGERLKEIKEMEKLRRGQVEEKKTSVSKLTQEEKEKKAQEMIDCAQALTEERRDRTGYNKSQTVEEEAEPERKEAKFFKKMQ